MMPINREASDADLWIAPITESTTCKWSSQIPESVTRARGGYDYARSRSGTRSR